MNKRLEKLKTGKFLPLLLFLLLAAGLLLLAPSPSSTAMTSEEKRISRTLSRIQGAGETEIAVFYAAGDAGFSRTSQRPTGAVIVSQGAGDIGVRLRLMQAAETLLGLNSGSVAVFEMEETK